MTLFNAAGELALEHSNSSGDAHLISGNAQRWRREFNILDEVDEWQVTRGDGMTVNANAGTLEFVSGVSTDVETVLTSRRKFTVPLRLQVSVGVSAKIANREFFVELLAADDDAPGLVDETVVAAWRVTTASPGTTASTTSVYEVRNGGAARLSTNGTIPTVVNASSPIVLLEMEIETDEAWFHGRTLDATTGRANSYVRQTTSPDPIRSYRLRLRQVNGPTAAATQTVRVGHVVISDYTEINVEVTGGRGAAIAGQAIPVNAVSGALTANLSSTGSTAVLVNKIISAASTNAALVAAATNTRRLQGFELANTSAAWRYVKIFNKGTAPTPGTDTPVMVIAVPPGGRAGLDLPFGGLAVASGLGVAITAGSADSDTAAVGAGDIVGTLIYS